MTNQSSATNLRGPDGEELVRRFAGRQPGTALVTTRDIGSNGYKPNFTFSDGTSPSQGAAKPSAVPPSMAETEARRAAALARNGARAPMPGYAGNAPQTAPAKPGLAFKAGNLAGRIAANPVTRLAGKAAGVGAVVQNFNDYKIDEPDVDSSASGTWSALRNGDFEGVGRSLKKGAVETAMDLGSFAANTADLFVPGTGPSQAYNKMLRDNLGDQLIDNSGNNPDPQGAPATPGAAAETPDAYPQANANSNARQLRLGDPSSPDLKDEFSNAMIENRNPGGKVTKVIGPDGKTSYSGGNVSGEVSFQGADGYALRGRPGGGYMSSSAEDGAARLAEARATLRNPDGSQWSAADNATMAANLRDGVDQYRGTSRASKGPTTDEQLQQAMAAYADPNRKLGTGKALRTQIEALTQRANNENSNRTTLRGQDMDREDRRAATEATREQTRALSLRAEAKDQRDYELNVARLGLEQANKLRDDKRAGEDAFDKRVVGLVGTDKEGKPDAAAASAVRNTVSAFLAQKQASAQAALKADPNNKDAARVLKDIETNGLAGVDEETLREIMLDQKVKRVAKAGAGPTPWGGTAAKTDKPLRSLTFDDSWLPFADKYVGDNGVVLTDDDMEDNPDFEQFLGKKAK